MVFTSQIFIFAFLPLCLFAYILARGLERSKCVGKIFSWMRSKDLVIIVFGLGFYMWSCAEDVLRILVYIGAVYFFALWIEAFSKKNRCIYVGTLPEGNPSLNSYILLKSIPFVIAVSSVVFCLLHYNYSGYFARVWNWVFKDHVEVKSFIAPLGLSFITFSAVSYLTDIYRGNATAGSLVDCALYLTFFPKVVSGPIVLWKDFQTEIRERKDTLEYSVNGLNRIMTGFAKKIILADSFGACIAQSGIYGMDQITAIGTTVLYMLQIYYDFSGYSDIAIGLSGLLGFEVKENFNFPYRSKSVSEFWRRWHISLGTWFREYVYFPLGGSKSGYYKTLRNLAIVFMLTGIWHGAGRNYILWGFLNGALVVIERMVQDKELYKKIPGFVKYCATMLAVMLLWLFFRFRNISDIIHILGIAFGTIKPEIVYYTWEYYFDMRILVFAVVGAIGATLLGSPRVIFWYKKGVSTNIGYALQELILLIVFILSVFFMVNSTYSPFIYFQY